MPIRAISFDLDDTLWAIDPVIERAEAVLHDWFAQHYPRIAERYGPDALRALRDQTARRRPELAHDLSALRRLVLEEATAACGHAPEVAEAAFDVLWNARNQVELYADVLPALEALAARWTLCALTNGNADVHRCGVGRWLGVCVTAREVGVAKPHPGIFSAACERLGVTPAELLHVGDDPVRDVAGARAAGVAAVWVNRSGAAWPGGPPPVAAIRSLDELPALLGSWA